MFERYSDAARNIVSSAQEEARLMRHEQVLGPDVVMAHVARLALGRDDDLTGVLGEPLEHGYARRRYPRANNR